MLLLLGKGAEACGSITGGSGEEKAASSASGKLSSHQQCRGIEKDTATGDFGGQRAQGILLPSKWHALLLTVFGHLGENYLISLNLIFIILLGTR